MKTKLLILVLCILFFTQSKAQSFTNHLPGIASITPYHLEVGYNVTTELIFPARLVPSADRGSRDIIILQEKPIDNILKVKAAKKDFLPTNLHAYTTDGKVYVFRVTYKEYPVHTTYDLSKVQHENDSSAYAIAIVNSGIADPNLLKDLASNAKNEKAFFSRKNKRFEMKLQLRTIHVAKGNLLFGFKLINRSNLDFDVEFMRMYIRDRKQIKRSSIQEIELLPVYKDNIKKVAGTGKKRFIIIVPKFTIPDKKEFLVEVFEKDGGRHISLKIKNKHLLRAKAFE